MKITVVRLAITAFVVMAVVFFLAYSRDMRWLGHMTSGLVTAGYVGGSVLIGGIIAGRLHRKPSPDRFIRHRKAGIALGVFAVISFGYGLWLVTSLGKSPLTTPHGWVGLSLAVVSLLQVVPSLLIKRRRRIKLWHRLGGYLMAVLAVSQVILGLLMTPLFAPLHLAEPISLPHDATINASWSPDGVISEREYFMSEIVDNGNFEIHYRSDSQYYCVGLKVKTSGWVGVGIDTGEGMQNAGVVVGYVDGNTVTVLDSFGISKYEHVPDTDLGGTNNIISFGGKETDSFTVIEFIMPMMSGDRYDVPLMAGSYNVIWAYGPADDFGKHSVAGHVMIELTE